MTHPTDTSTEPEATTKQVLRTQWRAAAPHWIERVRGPGDPARTALLDEWMLAAVGEVAGVDAVDLGCGEGRFCRMLAERRARVTGVDLCPTMVDAAIAHRIGDETYLLGDMEDLHELPAARFDLAVSYISLVDVADHRRAIGEAHRVLRPGGRFIACNLAPMVTAGNGWVRDGHGAKLHVHLDHYLDEGERISAMCGVQMRSIHRTLSSYVNTFIETGFQLEGLREPYPSPEQLVRCPGNADVLRVPQFIIYLLRKR